ncbi:hypothetical protein P43SY_011282 [Pythium insidiosum]|uniref:HECT-type E3 ubiquitin transferase n=1 Tax=Pythium insidiosum TaxID=114742 RepID=A0AAD5L5L7_PYTIN|nr:hypothetical protein P43SY_011282 [Pythium insidiosum]
MSPIQRRARFRKEWQRKVDVQGRPFWFRNAVDIGSVTHANTPGFVVQLTRPNDKATEYSSATSVEYVDAASADASRVGLSSVSFASMEKLQEAVELASKDFPNKYAHFVSQTASMLADVDMAHRPKLSIMKKRLALKQSLQQLSAIPVEQARSGLEVTLERQAMAQTGNLHREWFIEVAEKLALPESGLFTCTNRVDQTYHLNASASTDLGPGHLMYFHGAGRFVGRALVDGGVLPFHLSLPLLKVLVGTPLMLDDLQFFDPELHKSLTQVLETKGVESVGLDFSVNQVARDGSVSVVDLIPNGRNIAVTDENKALFVERKFKYTVLESVASQLGAFVQGVHEVVPVELLMLTRVSR